MPETIHKDGVEIEVFTAEELEAQRQAAIDQYKAENPDKSSELTELQAQLQAKEQELTGLKDKDLNFKNLRVQKEAAEKKAEELVKEIDAKISKAKNEVIEGVMKDHYGETLKALAGDDEDLKKKIEANYKRLGDSATTKDEISRKLRDAWVLTGKVDSQDALNTSVLSSGGVGKLNIKSQKNTFTPEEKDFAKKMAGLAGITLKDEDFK